MRSTAFGICIGLFLGLLPFVLSDHLFFGSVNAKFFYIITFIDVLLGVAAYKLWKSKNSIPSPKGKWFLLAFIMVLVVQYLAVFSSISSEHSLWSDIIRSTGVIFLTHIFALAFICGAYLKQGDWSFIRRSILISGAIFSLGTIVGADGLGLKSDFLWFNLGSQGLSIANSTFAGAYLVLTLIIGLIELAHSKLKSKWQIISLSSVVLVLLSPVLIRLEGLGSLFSNPQDLLGSARSSSVVAYAVVAFMLGYAVLKKMLPKKQFIVVFGAGCLVSLVAVISVVTLLFVPGSVVQEAYVDASSGARLVVWESGMEGFMERPLLGWGPENFMYAFEQNFDNRLYLDEYLGEVWFDRAHNVFVDTLVTTGVVGLLSFALLLVAFVFVVIRAHRKGRLLEIETVLLLILPIAHIVQSQTAFDTVTTYVLLSVIAGYILSIEKDITEARPLKASRNASKVVSVVAGVFALLSVTFVLLPELARQNALFETFLPKPASEQLATVKNSLARTSDFETLRLSEASFLKGVLITLGEGKGTAKEVQALMDVYEERYRVFITEEPDYYRARINYAYLLIIRTVTGQPRLDEAKQVLQEAYALSPENPATYILDALSELYSGNFALARIKADQALALNPDIKLSKTVREYIDKQEKQFPTITILKLENL